MNDRRTITSDDFEKIVAATSDVLPEAEQDEFRFFLRGFWEAGIPFGWLLQLMWDDVHWDGEVVRLRRMWTTGPLALPTNERLGRLLSVVPESLCRGHVFLPNREKRSPQSVTAAIKKLSKHAGVTVGVDNQLPVYANASDVLHGATNAHMPEAVAKLDALFANRGL
jgi:integrase